MDQRDVFMSGGTGYLGRALAARLLERGHAVRSLARPGSETKLPPGCEAVPGDALNPGSFAESVPPSDTFVHLTGTPKPAPWKGRQFRAVDQVSLHASLAAASSVGHFVYVSVAHPAPAMKAYIEVRRECETAVRNAETNPTIFRPWYILGPGHRWPLALQPFYWLAELLPATHEGALRLGLLTLEEMVRAMVWAIENPGQGVRIIDVPRIRAIAQEPNAGVVAVPSSPR